MNQKRRLQLRTEKFPMTKQRFSKQNQKSFQRFNLLKSEMQKSLKSEKRKSIQDFWGHLEVISGPFIHRNDHFMKQVN